MTDYELFKVLCLPIDKKIIEESVEKSSECNRISEQGKFNLYFDKNHMTD